MKFFSKNEIELQEVRRFNVVGGDWGERWKMYHVKEDEKKNENAYRMVENIKFSSNIEWTRARKVEILACNVHKITSTRFINSIFSHTLEKKAIIKFFQSFEWIMLLKSLLRLITISQFQRNECFFQETRRKNNHSTDLISESVLRIHLFEVFEFSWA